MRRLLFYRLLARGFAFTLALSGCPRSEPDDLVRESPAPAAPSWVDVAVRLRGVEPGGSHEDLRALRASFVGARVIAIGEGTHGSHEFFALRERLLAWGVAELGVRALAIESSMAEVAELDRYIQGEGEPGRAAELVVRNSSWPWRTVEFAATLEWLREHNDGLPVDDRVHLYGIDIQQPWVTLDHLRQTFAEDREVVAALDGEDLRRLAVTPAEYAQYNQDQRDRTRAALEQLDGLLRARGIDPLSLRMLGTLMQVEAHYRIEDHRGVSPAREQAMADNVRWLAETLHADAPIMVWAHNGHVSRKPLHPSHSDVMGRYLAEHFQQRFVNVGFVFAGGKFLAKDRNDELRPIREFELPAGPTDGLGPRLAAGGLPLFALDLRLLPADSPLRAWLDAEPRRGWVVGSVVADPIKQVGELELLACFDLIVFVDRVTPSTLVDPGSQARSAAPRG